MDGAPYLPRRRTTLVNDVGSTRTPRAAASHPYQGHGSRQTLQPLAPHQYVGWAFTLDAAPSTYDARSQLWVFGLCVHTLSMGQLKRLGAIASIPTGDQTKARALVAGLVALAKHTTAPVKVIVQVASVWAAWQTHHRYQPFPDLLEDLTIEDTQRVTVLYVSRNTRTPEAPGNEPQLRRRQRDAALVAWERANNLHDKRQTERQKTVDQDNTMIYKRAIQRLVKIYEDKEHYIHDKAPRQLGKQTKQRKKDLVNQCRQPWTPQHHRWEPHRGGYHCSACGAQMHQGLTASLLDERLHEQCNKCSQLQLDEHRPAVPPLAPELTKKPTRAQLIRQLLHSKTHHQLLTSASWRKPRGTSNARDAELMSISAPMSKRSRRSSRALTSLSKHHMKGTQVTACGKRATKFGALSYILTANRG